MRIIRFSLVQLFLLLLLCLTANAGNESFEEAAKLLPDRLANFKATGAVRGLDDDGDVFNGTAIVTREYESPDGPRFSVELFRHASDSAAYARLTHAANITWFSDNHQEIKAASVGTLGYVLPDSLVFYKGPIYVTVTARSRKGDEQKLLDFARQLAETLDKGEGEIPALVKHLPYWESGALHPAYAVKLAGLKEYVPDQPVFDAIKFDGGVEAASSVYDNSRLVIVEFTTPQLATENDRAIAAKISDLRSQSQPAPTAYRRS